MDDKRLEQLMELNTQYKILRNSGIVREVSLVTNVGNYEIKNSNIIAKVLDLLIHESQEQLESEVKK